MEENLINFNEGRGLVLQAIVKLRRILEGSPEPQLTSDEYLRLYTTIFTMCVQDPPYDYSKQLYAMYRETLKEYIDDTVLPSMTEKEGEALLRELVKNWANYKKMVRCLSRIFCYLEQYFIVRMSLPSLNDVGLIYFRDMVCHDMQNAVTNAVISLIRTEREGFQVDRAPMKNVFEIFMESDFGSMHCYKTNFEAAVLADTATYYSQKASEWIHKDSLPIYMLKAEECLMHEKERVAHCLHSSTEHKLLEEVRHELLSRHAIQLLESNHYGLHALFCDEMVEDLKRMYRLFSSMTNGLDLLAPIFKHHITTEGTALVKQAEDAALNEIFVEKVIEMHVKYLVYVNDCFMDHPLCKKALKEAFEVFCNKGVAGVSSAELLAAYCDDILKKGGSEKPSDEVAEETLEKVVNLVEYINDKDLYAEFYRRKLARRLLCDKNAKEDLERSILMKHKHHYGLSFTSNMEGMVTDMTLARENHPSFKQYLNNNQQAYPGIDMSVTVLNSLHWPSYQSLDLILPKEMAKCVEVFKEFYKTQTKNRKLTWIYSLGTCNVVGKFESKTIELIVSTSQAAALLLFNNADRLSYKEIMTQLNLSADDLMGLLQSLSCGKYKILNKEPNSNIVTPKDCFEFNFKFTDKMRKIRLSLPPVDEKKVDEKKVDTADVVQDRRYEIEACITRIMKRHKVLSYKDLALECVQQLSRKFKPDSKAIKRSLEDLINTEYLERDDDNPNVFRYLA